ncbi:hypothetical protein Vau01_100370 [Virgisporangium aurantiacum]|uniref:Uncharacterized protein n=1 Tax=Virgisporangium aurantiacum TaxID=175570 RepID=A0A8J3ZEN2_9ACTN|nr:hypothetical protein Vau01_100370 [Virgisporangium aurantiacum]
MACGQDNVRNLLSLSWLTDNASQAGGAEKGRESEYDRTLSRVFHGDLLLGRILSMSPVIDVGAHKLMLGSFITLNEFPWPRFTEICDARRIPADRWESVNVQDDRLPVVGDRRRGPFASALLYAGFLRPSPGRNRTGPRRPAGAPGPDT